MTFISSAIAILVCVTIASCIMLVVRKDDETEAQESNDFDDYHLDLIEMSGDKLMEEINNA